MTQCQCTPCFQELWLEEVVCAGPHLLQEPQRQIGIICRYIQLAFATFGNSIVVCSTVDPPGNAAANWTTVQSQYVENNGLRQLSWHMNGCLIAHCADLRASSLDGVEAATSRLDRSTQHSRLNHHAMEHQQSKANEGMNHHKGHSKTFVCPAQAQLYNLAVQTCQVLCSAAQCVDVDCLLHPCRTSLYEQLPADCCCRCCASVRASLMWLTGCISGAGGANAADPDASSACPAALLPSASAGAQILAVPRSSCCSTCCQITAGPAGGSAVHTVHAVQPTTQFSSALMCELYANSDRE